MHAYRRLGDRNSPPNACGRKGPIGSALGHTQRGTSPYRDPHCSDHVILNHATRNKLPTANEQHLDISVISDQA